MQNRIRPQKNTMDATTMRNLSLKHFDQKAAERKQLNWLTFRIKLSAKLSFQYIDYGGTLYPNVKTHLQNHGFRVSNQSIFCLWSNTVISW